MPRRRIEYGSRSRANKCPRWNHQYRPIPYFNPIPKDLSYSRRFPSPNSSRPRSPRRRTLRRRAPGRHSCAPSPVPAADRPTTRKEEEEEEASRPCTSPGCCVGREAAAVGQAGDGTTGCESDVAVAWSDVVTAAVVHLGDWGTMEYCISSWRAAQEECR